jgi:hypothetical protein
MMPISYSGFGPTAILLMLGCLIISQAIKYYRHRSRKVVEKKEAE